MVSKYEDPNIFWHIFRYQNVDYYVFYCAGHVLSFWVGVDCEYNCERRRDNISGNLTYKWEVHCMVWATTARVISPTLNVVFFFCEKMWDFFCCCRWWLRMVGVIFFCVSISKVIGFWIKSSWKSWEKFCYQNMVDVCVKLLHFLEDLLLNFQC